MISKQGETNRIFLNFCEYQFKGNYNSFCNFPNSDFVRTSLNNNIKRNFVKEIKREGGQNENNKLK